MMTFEKKERSDPRTASVRSIENKTRFTPTAAAAEYIGFPLLSDFIKSDTKLDICIQNVFFPSFLAYFLYSGI